MGHDCDWHQLTRGNYYCISGDFDTDSFVAETMCCVCDGGEFSTPPATQAQLDTIKGEQGDNNTVQGPQGIQGDDYFGNSHGSTITQVQIETIRGPRGLRGIQGEIGKQGLDGLQGVLVKGEKGDTGDRGPIGNETGEIGYIGPQGVKGINGTKGYIGYNGTIGPEGLQGIKGEKGEQGPIGPSRPLPDFYLAVGLNAIGFISAIFNVGFMLHYVNTHGVKANTRTYKYGYPV